GADHVVRRGHEAPQWPGPRLVVADCPERPDLRHGMSVSTVRSGPYSRPMAIADLDADRVVEGTFAVARKERLRTRAGAPYLALELVDRSGRIDARVWNDVELLDNRFAEGDA